MYSPHSPTAPPRRQLQRVSHTHEAVATWLIANPQLSLRECADAFGYTQAWLSTLIHSDAFQEHLHSKQGSAFSAIAQELTTKLRAAADVGIEKLQRHLEHSEDPRFALDATDKLLHRLGFAPRPIPQPGLPATQTNNFYLVDRETLAAHRGTIVSGEARQVEEASALPPTA